MDAAADPVSGGGPPGGHFPLGRDGAPGPAGAAYDPRRDRPEHRQRQGGGLQGAEVSVRRGRRRPEAGQGGDPGQGKIAEISVSNVIQLHTPPLLFGKLTVQKERRCFP